MNIEQAANFALKQLDSIGYYLSRYGISDQVNRHNLIALAVTEKEHLLGELSRLELRARIQMNKLEKLALKLDQQADQMIAKTPKPVATQLTKAKAFLV